MKAVNCTECDARLEVKDDVRIDEIIDCTDCEVELRVTRIDPLEVEFVEEEENLDDDGEIEDL